ncbi:MAG: hypothetical protein M3P06_24395 [Acidobacteriota bacterium]|nr:hypothetical protein [Acidobacteriota bacterium]
MSGLQKTTAPIDWSGAYDKVMVDAGKSAEAIDIGPYTSDVGDLFWRF